MNQNHKELISIGLTLGIILVSLFIIHRFLPSITWAGIIAIATYPLYKRWQKFLNLNDSWAAFIFTTLLGLMLLLPLSWLISILIHETQLFINYLQDMNNNGGGAPIFLKQIPFLGPEIENYWEMHFGKPGNVREVLSQFHIALTPASYYIKQVGVSIAHRSFQVGFTLLTLFFFYRDGKQLYKEIQRVGEQCLGARWFRYAEKLPSALRGTVNGTIVVGLGVGLCMGVCYLLVGLPAPTLTGFLTAFASMIPFVVPIVLAIIALFLFSVGNLMGAVLVVIWGSLVVFIADHFVKPVLIGGAIQLPFLAVLFGILGGLETLGLLGLFIGPMVMVLFITLWQELQE